MPTTRQTSFAAGELDPKLWGRNDLSIFNHGLRHALNFFITKQGAAVSRPGTKYVAASYSTDLSASVRLIPFHYSDTDSVIIEFGPLYIRFYQNGAPVESSPGVPLTIVTTLSSANIDAIRYTQFGNSMWLTCGQNGPYVLTRVSTTSWSWTYTVPGASVAQEVMDVDTDVRTNGFMLQSNFVGTADAAHPSREWVWWYAALRQDPATGAIYEEMATKVSLEYDTTTYPGVGAVAIRTSLPVYSDMRVILARTAPVALTSLDDRVVAWNIYRGRGNLAGFVGQTKTREFVDVGETPDYSKQPRLSNDPLGVYTTSGAGAVLTDREQPVGIGFFESRLILAGTDLQPYRIRGSAVGDIANFDIRTLAPPGSAIQFDLSMRRFERIQHVVTMERLIVHTDASAWSVGGHQGNPLDATSIDAKVIEDIGCHDVAPLTFDGVVIYARRKGFGVRMIAPAQTLSGYQGVSVSDHAQHLFGYRIVDWCHQEDPFGLIWAVREDGKLLSGTLDKASGHIAWCEHETDGIVESIASVPEDEEDAVYIVVQRTVNGSTVRHIERMTSRLQWPDDPDIDGICLDSVVTSAATPSTTISGLDTLIGEEVYATGQGLPVYGPFTVDAAGEIELPETPTANDGANLTIHVGRRYSCELETLDVAHSSARMQQKGLVRVGFEVYDSTGLEVGPDQDNLTPWRQRQVSESYGIVGSATELVSVAVKGTYDLTARAFLRQQNPKHVTVVGITRVFDGGGT